jgi:hypothetical protein
MVGVGWICERISVWSFLVQDCRNVSHRPWWTCPVALGSWGSGGRCLRANPLRRRGTAETVQRGSLWVHALRGCVNAGRLLPVALTSSFRRQGGVPDYLFLGSFVLRSGRLSSPRPSVGCVLFPHGSICGFGSAAFAVGNPVLWCCSSEQDRGCCLGTVRGSALRSGRQVGCSTNHSLFGAGGWCNAETMALRTRLPVGDKSSASSELEVFETTPGQVRPFVVLRGFGLSLPVRSYRVRAVLRPSLHALVCGGLETTGLTGGVGHTHPTTRSGWVRRCGLRAAAPDPSVGDGFEGKGFWSRQIGRAATR